MRDFYLHHRPPFRALRLAEQTHIRLMRSSIGFLCVALDAGTNNVIPIRRSAHVSWNNVIEIHLAPLEPLAAILASVLVPLIDVMAGKLDVLANDAIKQQQQNDPRNPELNRGSSDNFVADVIITEISPFV